MKLSRLPVVLALAVMLIAFPALAHANCTQDGKVVYVSVPYLSGGQVTIQLAPLTDTPTFYYQYTAFNPTELFVSALTAAMAGGLTVTLVGNAGSCPSSGTIRDAGSVIQFLKIHRR